MPIPNYQSIMLPVLKFLGDSQEHPLNEIIEHIYKTSNLTEEEKRRLLPSGREPIFRNRIRWARFYLEKAGLIESPRRAFSKITKRGLGILRDKPPKLTVKYLERFPEFVEFKTRKKEEEKDQVQRSFRYSLDPIELLENAHQKVMNCARARAICSCGVENSLKYIPAYEAIDYYNKFMDLLNKK